MESQEATFLKACERCRIARKCFGTNYLYPVKHLKTCLGCLLCDNCFEELMKREKDRILRRTFEARPTTTKLD